MNKVDKKGQTIIEVMVAATLITIIMSAVLNLMYTGLKFSLQTREETILIGKANKFMNEGLYQVNISYPIPDADIPNVFDRNVVENGFVINRDLVALQSDGESEEPCYDIVNESGQALFMKLVITASIPDKGIVYEDSRVVKVK